MPHAAAPSPRRDRGTVRRVLIVLGLVLCAGFAALGSWQLQRRVWKLALIERVQQRVHAAPVALPNEAQWAAVTRETHEYQPVHAHGHWMPENTVRVQALTEAGAGFWLLTPLRLDAGGLLIVNRGFVPTGHLPTGHPPAGADSLPPGRAAVQGLLRMSEPGGGFLRRNDPAAGRWFSRDVAAIARAQGLSRVAPFFVDAGLPAQVAPPDAWPRPGLTVIRFRNTHMSYALTWFTLAGMTLAASIWLFRQKNS